MGWLAFGFLTACGGDGPATAAADTANPDGVSDIVSDAFATPVDDVVADGAVSDIVSDVSSVGHDTVGHDEIRDDGQGPDTWSDTRVPVEFTVTVPPETPAAASVLVVAPFLPEPLVADCGAALTVCQVTALVPAPVNTTWTVVVDHRGTRFGALDLFGAPDAPESLEILADATNASATATVERFGPPTGASRFALAFLVTPPPSTPPHEGLFVVGSAAELGGWSDSGRALEIVREGRWGASIDIANFRSLEFKVTRGSWYTVEKGPAGEEISNRRADIGGGLRRVEVSPASWADVVPPGTGTLTGDVRVLRGVASAHVEQVRDVTVWLPPAYRSQPDARFPVFYLHDGQNLMNAATAFAGVEWRVDETLGALIAGNTVRPVIAVAVHGTAARIAEYTPTADPGIGRGGGAAAYGRFLVDELKPLIDAHYRTEDGPDATGLGGSSLGGLVTMWLGLEYPRVFGRLAVISPSVWWDGRMILDAVAAYRGPTSARIWLDIGTAEGSGTTAVDNARALRNTLTSKGWVDNVGLAYRELAGAGHNEAAWAARFGDIAAFLFGP